MPLGGEPIGKLQLQVGLDDTTVKRGLTNLNAQMKLTDNTWKASLSTFKQSDRSIEKLSVSIKGMQEKLKVSNQLVNVHKDRVAKLTAEYGENHTKVIKANAELKKQESVMGNLKRSIGEVTEELKQLQKAEQINNSPWMQRSKELEQFSTKMNAIGDKMTSVGQNMTMGVTAPLAGIGAVSVKTAMEFDAQMSRVGAIADATKGQLGQMKDVAMDLGAKTTKSASEVALGMEEMAAKGFTVNEIIQSMPGIISAAEASGSDMAQTANVMASAMNAFGLEASQSNHVADVLAMTANKTAADITDMEYALKYAAAPAKALGMSMEETSAGIGMMVDAGLKGEQAGTTLRGALLGLLDPSEENSKRMNKMGIEITDAQGNFVGLSKLVENLSSSMDGMTETQKAATLSQLVGKEAVSGMLVLMGQGPEKIDSLTNSLEKSDGASKKAADSMMDNLKGAVEEMSGAFETIGIQIGQDLTPMLRKLAGYLQGAADKFSSMPGWARKTAVGIGLVAAATGPVILGLGMVAKAAGNVSGGLSKLTARYAANTVAAQANAASNTAAGATMATSGSKFGKFTGVLGKFGKSAGSAGGSVGLLSRGATLLRGGLTALSGPVGIVIAAITAAGVAFKLAYDHVGWFRTGVDNSVKLFKQVGSSIDWSWIGKIGDGFKWAGDKVGGFTSRVGKVAGKVLELTPQVKLLKAGFGIVNDAVTKATDKVDVFGSGVSKSTEKALKGYTDLSMKASQKLEELKLSHQVIGGDTLKSVTKIYDDINKTVTTKLQTRHDREMSGLRKLFIDTKGLKDSEEQKILTEASSGNNQEVKAVKMIQDQIKGIYQNAHKEKRALTKVEENKIAMLQEQMDKRVVASLSKSEKEQRIILGRLKSNKGKLSLEAAAAVIKNSAKERDETIKDARKKRDKIIDEAIYQRDVTGNLSKKQADKIIKEAERQYSESKKNAEKQHKKVVDEAAKQNAGVRKHIDSQTGRVKSKWEEMHNSVSKWSGKMAAEAINGAIGIKNGFEKWLKKTGETLDRWKTDLKKKASSLGISVANGAISGLNGMIDGINKISMKIMDKKLLKKIPELSTGTRNGRITSPTPAIVGDRGPGNGPGGFRHEIIKRRDGSMHLTPNRDTLVHLDRGDSVINGRDTHALMQSGQIPKFSKGTDEFFGALGSGIRASGAWIKDKAVDATKYIGKIAGDVMDYIENPGKLVDMVVGNLGNLFGGVGGFTGDLASAAFKKLKSGLVNKVKDWFDEMGGNGDGSSFSGFPITTPYSPNARPPGYPYPANHYGVDFGTPQGHPINAPTAGILSTVFDPHGGQVAILKMANGWQQFFMHMEKVRKAGAIKAGAYLGNTGGQAGLRNSGSWSTGPHLHYQVNQGSSSWNSGTVNPLDFLSKHGVKDKIGKGSGSGSWLNQIQQAAQQMKVTISAADKALIAKLIQTESGGNAGITQQIVDMNTGANRARGLLQYVPTTFANYAVAGHKNITKGYDQLVAFFNNKNWRSDLNAWDRRMSMGLTGWGPTGARRYANGGIVTKPHQGIVGEAGPEIIIPLSKAKRTRAEELLKIANGLINKGNINKTQKTSANDIALGKLIQSKMDSIKKGNATQIASAVKSINTKINSIVAANDKKVLTNNTRVADYNQKNMDDSYKLKTLQQELALNGKKGKVTTYTRLPKASTTVIDSNITKAKIQRDAANKEIKALKTAQDKLKKLLAGTKDKKARDSYNKQLKKAADDLKKQQKLESTASANLKKLEKQRADALKVRYKAETKTIKARSKTSVQKEILNVKNRIAKNKDLITNLKKENTQYAAQSKEVKKVTQNEVLKSKVLIDLEKKRAALAKKVTDLQTKQDELKQQKTEAKASLSSNMQNYAGFSAVRGHSVADFLSFMQYRMNKLKEFQGDITKLKGMGLDPAILRELIEGGIESAGAKVKILLRGGPAGIAAINAMQAKINSVINSISSSQANTIYDPQIKEAASGVAAAKKESTALTKQKEAYLNAPAKVTKTPAKTTAKKATKTPATSATKKVTKIVNKDYKIAAGDTLSAIAKKYGTTVAELKKINSLKSDLIISGKTLKVPVKIQVIEKVTKTPTKAAVKTPAKTAAKAPTTHKIKAGDTLGEIAKKYGTTVSALKTANKLSSDLIIAGKTLKLPAPKPVAKAAPSVAQDATKYILDTAKKLALGKDDKKVKELQKQIDKIKNDKDKKNDKLIADLAKQLKENDKKAAAQNAQVLEWLKQIAKKDTTVVLNGQKVSQTVNNTIAKTTKTTERRKTS